MRRNMQLKNVIKTPKTPTRLVFNESPWTHHYPKVMGSVLLVWWQLRGVTASRLFLCCFISQESGFKSESINRQTCDLCWTDVTFLDRPKRTRCDCINFRIIQQNLISYHPQWAWCCPLLWRYHLWWRSPRHMFRHQTVWGCGEAESRSQIPGCGLDTQASGSQWCPFQSTGQQWRTFPSLAATWWPAGRGWSWCSGQTGGLPPLMYL